MLDWIARTVDSRGFITAFAFVVGAVMVWSIVGLPEEHQTPSSIAAIIQTGAIVVGLLSLVLIARQIRATATQTASSAAISRALTYHQFFGDLITAEIRQKMEAAATSCGFKDARKSGEPMTQQAVKCIKEDPGHDGVVASYLDEFEEFCGAIHAGLLDEDYAYGLEATRVIRTWKVFSPYVQATRLETSDHRTYIELERIADAWLKRRADEDQRESDARAQRNAANGVKNRIPSADRN